MALWGSGVRIPSAPLDCKEAFGSSPRASLFLGKNRRMGGTGREVRGCSSVLVEHHNGIVGVREPPTSVRDTSCPAAKTAVLVGLHRRVEGPDCFAQLRHRHFSLGHPASLSRGCRLRGSNLLSSTRLQRSLRITSEGFFVSPRNGPFSRWRSEKQSGCSSVLVEHQSAFFVSAGMSACLDGEAASA